MKKRGFLLAEETLKIILGVIAIGFLAFLLFSLYSHSKDAKELELARESLDFIMDEVSLGKTTVDIYNPEGWNLGVWPHEIEESFIPEILSNIPGVSSLPKTKERLVLQTCENFGWKSCICICPKNSKGSCDSKGYCVNNPDGWDIWGKNIELNDLPLTLDINQAQKEISE